MVIASHVIIGMYGFWLPNDECGSWSDFVGSWELLRFGKATTVSARRSQARQPFDPARRAAAQAALKYPRVLLSGIQARAVARPKPPITMNAGATAGRRVVVSRLTWPMMIFFICHGKCPLRAAKTTASAIFRS
jgi:hypothetical protein